MLTSKFVGGLGLGLRYMRQYISEPVIAAISTRPPPTAPPIIAQGVFFAAAAVDVAVAVEEVAVPVVSFVPVAIPDP